MADGRAPQLPLAPTRVVDAAPAAVTVGTEAATPLAATRAAHDGPRTRESAASEGVRADDLAPRAGQSVVRPGTAFYQLLRRMECARRDLPRLGEAPIPAEEPVRLRQDPAPQFEAASVVSITPGTDRGPDSVQVGFFGAFGPNGPLPLHLTEYAYQRALNEHDPTFGAFLNVFHHRLLLLFYRVWASAQPTVARDRPDSDRFAQYMRACAGQPTPPGVRPSDPLEAMSSLLGRHFANRTRHPEGLSKLLCSYLGVPARVEEFVGEWLEIPDPYCWRVGAVRPDNGQPLGMLGTSTRVGTQVWERQFGFEVVLGPLKRSQLEALLPGTTQLRRVTDLIRRYAGGALRWRLRLVLSEPEIQPSVLGRRGQLGLTSYIGSPEQDDRGGWEDLVIDPLIDNR